MITKLKDFSEIDILMAIWLETNKSAHSFIPNNYWNEKYELVKHLLPTAEIYSYELDNRIIGFIGVVEKSYIAGLFILDEYQSKGNGKKLLEYCKVIYPKLELDVYTKNQKAVNFYIKNNFEIASIEIDENTGNDEYHMVWKKLNFNMY